MKIYVVWKDIGSELDYYYNQQKEPIKAFIDKNKAIEYIKIMNDRVSDLYNIEKEYSQNIITFEKMQEIKTERGYLNEDGIDEVLYHSYDEIELDES